MSDENQDSKTDTEPPETLPSPATTGAASTTENVQATTLHDLMKLVLIDEKLTAKEKKTLIDELRKNNAYSSDRWTYRYAILILGGAIIMTIGALWALSCAGKTPPEGLIALGSAAAGGLAGLLTPSRATENNPA